MSLLSEELLISQHSNSNKSSNINDSLTAKLGNMLHSSDEIIAENTDFFKPSSNELTEYEEVHSLPHSDSQPMPRLNNEERNRASKSYTEYKSGESYTSLGTVVRHETSKIGQKNVRSVKHIRPASVKPQRHTSRGKNSTNREELYKFLQKVAKKNPDCSNIIKQDLTDIEKIFLKKLEDYEKALENDMSEVSFTQNLNSNKENLKKKNKEKEKKREEIRVKFREEELDRMRKSFTKFEENCKFRLNHAVDHTLKKYKTQKHIEDEKFLKETESHHKLQKQTVIENIKNFYNDKIQMLKQKLAERKVSKLLLSYEHKQLNSEAEKTRRQEQSALHETHKNLLKFQLASTKLQIDLQEQSACTKILSAYKNSFKSLKSLKY